jgi:hypothetical protein
MMAWATTRADVTCDTPVAVSDNRYADTALPGPFFVRILLWLLILGVFPLSVTSAALSFNLEVLGRIPYAALPPERHVQLFERVLARLENR